MIRAVSSFLALLLAVPTTGQAQHSDFVSPCPNVFTYEPPGTEAGKWYGVVNLTTDSTFYALWLNIVLEDKADILGNWVGEVTTEDNMDFKIENTKMKILPGQPQSIRFFIQYNAQKSPPKLKAIRFNGREICDIEPTPVIETLPPVRTAISYEAVRPEVTTSTTARPTATTTMRNQNRQQTTAKTQYWQPTEKPQTKATSVPASFWTQAKAVNNYQTTSTTTIKPKYWTEAKTTELTTAKPQYWQLTTLKPIFWTQTPDTKTSTTAASTTQRWSQTRADTKTSTTEKYSEPPKVDNWSYTKAGNSQLSKTQNRNVRPANYQNSSDTKLEEVRTQYKVESNQPNVKVSDSQHASKGSRPEGITQTGVTNVLQAQYWSGVSSGNITEPANPSKTESTVYVWPQAQDNTSYDKVKTQTFDRPVKEESVEDYNYPSNTPIYVRPENKPVVSDDTYKVRDNLQTRTQAPSRTGTDSYRKPVRPTDSYQKNPQPTRQSYNERVVEAMPVRVSVKNSMDSQRWSGEKTSSWSGDNSQSWNDEVKNKMEYQSGAKPPSYSADDSRVKNFDESVLPFLEYQLTTTEPSPVIFKRPTDFEDYDMPKKEMSNEYYFGGLPIFYIPNHGPRTSIEPSCGKVLLNTNKGRNVKSTTTFEGRWPWQIALYQQQTSVDFRYVCGGTLVSKRHVITAAHCVAKRASSRPVNRNTLTVYLGKFNLRTSVDGVQVKFVNRIVINPDYDASTFKSDLAILELKESITYSDWVQPACLWPDYEVDLKDIVGKTGSVVGWGYEATGAAREELSLLEMPVVDQETCINSYREFFLRFTSDKTYCAGHGHAEACNGDSGGGMVFQRGDIWYLRGVVSLSVARQGEHRCDPNHYVIFTDIAKFLPWIEDNIDGFY